VNPWLLLRITVKSKIKNQIVKIQSKNQKYILFFICIFNFYFLIFHIIFASRLAYAPSNNKNEVLQ